MTQRQTGHLLKMMLLAMVSALRSPHFAPNAAAIALMTALGIFAAFSVSPRCSRKPLRNKGISRLSLTGRHKVEL